MAGSNNDLDSENELKRQKNLEEWDKHKQKQSDEETEKNYTPSGGYLWFSRDARRVAETFAVFYFFYELIRFIIFLFQKLFGLKIDEENLPNFQLLKVVGLVLGTIFLVFVVVWLLLKF